MIQHTFTLLDGIGERTEKRLWSQGILFWEDFLNESSIPYISAGRISLLKELLLGFKFELDSGNSTVFKQHLKSSEHWRLLERFKSEVVCLDIETNGLPAGRGGEVTVVGLYDGVHYDVLIQGENLTEDTLMEKLSRYKLLITFFGASFDIPFLRKKFRGFLLNIPHFDLCHGARRVGMKGGLKKLEVQLGLKRAEEVAGLDGYDAVLLWRQWLKGSSHALDLLIKYNREDTVNLLYLAEYIYNLLRKSTGIEVYLNGR